MTQIIGHSGAPRPVGTRGAALIEATGRPLAIRDDMQGAWKANALSFDQAADVIVQAHKEDGEIEDVPIGDLRGWGVVPLGEEMGLVPLTGGRPRKLRKTGFSGLCQRFGIPSDYVRDRLGAKLQIATLNYSMATAPEAVPGMLRCRGDEIACVVSEKYEPLDQVELMQTVRDSLVRFDLLDKVRVEAVSSGMIDVMRFTLPHTDKAVRVGDISRIGFDMRTSSFGQSSVAFSDMVYRLVCTNGMTRSDQGRKQSFRHVGKMLRARVGERIPSAIAQATDLFRRWESSVAVMIDDVASLITGLDLPLYEQANVSKELVTALETKALPAHEVPLYDIVNAITASARQYAPARRLEVERIAGDILVGATA